MDASDVTTDSSADLTQFLNKLELNIINLQKDYIFQKSETKEFIKEVKVYHKKINQLNSKKGTKQIRFQDDLKAY
ncbi:hypothetical protein F4604DRAFT_1927625 [Suillus subluteus]|nr:hypothetical protein F4604DRAFT_1927625 [Suillus subluteus]